MPLRRTDPREDGLGRVQVTSRLPRETYNKVRELSKRERRSLDAQISLLVEAGLGMRPPVEVAA